MSPSYHLYYFPNTASFSVHWVLVRLEQLGLLTFDTTLVNLPKGEQKRDDYLSVNPKGRIPVLVINSTGEKLSESPAILQYLAEAFPSAQLAPAVGEEGRNKYLETITVLANFLLPALRDRVYAEKDYDGPHPESIHEVGVKRVGQAWDILDKQLEGKQYLVGGDAPSVCDYLAVSVTKWFPEFEEEARKRPNVAKLVDAMQGRDDWKEVRRREEAVRSRL